VPSRSVESAARAADDVFDVQSAEGEGPRWVERLAHESVVPCIRDESVRLSCHVAPIAAAIRQICCMVVDGRPVTSDRGSRSRISLFWASDYNWEIRVADSYIYIYIYIYIYNIENRKESTKVQEKTKSVHAYIILQSTYQLGCLNRKSKLNHSKVPSCCP